MDRLPECGIAAECSVRAESAWPQMSGRGLGLEDQPLAPAEPTPSESQSDVSYEPPNASHPTGEVRGEDTATDDHDWHRTNQHLPTEIHLLLTDRPPRHTHLQHGCARDTRKRGGGLRC
jgi:hypothetical protein